MAKNAVQGPQRARIKEPTTIIATVKKLLTSSVIVDPRQNGPSDDAAVGGFRRPRPAQNSSHPSPAGTPPRMMGMITMPTSSWFEEVSPLIRKPMKNSAPQPPHRNIISRPIATKVAPKKPRKASVTVAVPTRGV